MYSFNCKKFQLFTIILLLCSSFSRQQTTPSNEDFGHKSITCDITINGDCIVYNTTKMTWDVAEQNCIQLGGHLTSILSEEENSLISANRSNSMITGSTSKDYFIGCNDKVDCRNFTWSDGTLFNYTNWGNGEPSSNNERCCEMIDSGKWNDNRCNGDKKMSICKISAKVQCIGSDRFFLNQTCIVYNDDKMNWTAAEQYCIGLGGHLASIHSEEEDTAIWMNKTKNGIYYIGYNDMANEGNLTWSDNTQIDYIATIPITDVGVNNDSQDCSGSSNNILMWVFRDCSRELRSICRIPGVYFPVLAVFLYTKPTNYNKTTITPSTCTTKEKIEEAKNQIKSFLVLSYQARNYIITEEFLQNLIKYVDTINVNIEKPLTAEIDSNRVIAIRALNVLNEHSDLIFINISNNESFTFEFGSVFFEIDSNNVTDVPLNSTITFPFTAVNRSNTETIAIPQSVFLQIETNASRILVTTYILRVNISMGNNNQVATNIFSINIPGIQPDQILPEPVRITFPTIRTISNPLCSFIDFTSNPPIFNQSGLRLVDNSPDSIVCESTHLTSFAVLAGSMTQPSTDIERLALSITSYVLLSLSLLFMVASIVAYLVSYKTVFKAEINILYFNFSIALTIAILTFFISNIIDKTTNINKLCSGTAFLLHYSWINVFTSGTACSISLTYAITITLLGGNRKRIFPYLIVSSWGLPLLVTVPTVAIGVFHYHAYSTSNGICMLSSKNNMIVAFYAPILLLILLNIILLVVILFLLWKAYRIQDKNASNELLLFKKLITSTLILLPILGLPFLLVPIIAHVNISNSAIDWIFIFLYCPIGIVFFLLVTLRNSDISHNCSKLCRKATSEDSEANVAQRGNDEELKVYQNFFAFLMIASEKHVKQSNM